MSFAFRKELNRLNAFLKGKRVMRTIPFKNLPKNIRDANEFNGKYMIMNSKSKHNLKPKPFVRVQVKDISEI